MVSQTYLKQFPYSPTLSQPTAEAPCSSFIRNFDVMPDPMFDDMWERAQMPEVLQYLRGGAGISILVPEEWEGYLPKSPPEPPIIVD